MKKLNITREGFEKSKYLQNKYGKLEYVSESGNLYKTETGNILKFKEKVNPRNTLKRKGEMEEPIDDIEDVENIDDEENNLSPAKKKLSAKKGKSPKMNLTCFDELKDYIEDAENRPYNREVGAAVDGDGRLGSVADEGNIIAWLQEIFDGTNVEIKKPAARAWYDVELSVNGKSYYTNIKTTAGGADNISSKEGVLYYLSGGNATNFKDFIKNRKAFALKEGDDAADYFLLVMFKNSKKILFTSLGRLGILTPNFYNQPFQIPWNKSSNQDGSAAGRSPIEQKQYVASVWYRSIASGLEKLNYQCDFFKSLSGKYVQDA